MRVGATKRARAPGRRTRAPGAVLFAAMGAFLLICGLLLLWMAPGSASSEDEAVLLDRQAAMSALDSAQLAERAMDANNYGEARVHLRNARQTLSGLLRPTKEEAADEE